MGRYCVIGKSLPHTLSPKLHSAFGPDFYGVCELADSAALKRFVQAREFDGYNVTIPYKQEIIPFLDEISAEAAAIGAVNTVVNENVRLVGYNTDVFGMKEALAYAEISVFDKNVLILGSGGTSHTAQYLVKTLGAKSAKVVSRSGELNYSNCYDRLETQVIINTTPVGMMPHADGIPIDVGRFADLEGVFDCVYNPLKTRIVFEAQKRGIKAANGLVMLAEQARLAHNLFMRASGKAEAEKSATFEVLDGLISKTQNVVLIGMSGSGKTVVGRAVADMLGRTFVDTDAEIEKREGRTIPEIFADDGETYFRECESRVIEDACSKQGLVISTGGGAAMNEKNVFFMGANGTVVFLKADGDNLAIANRPLTPNIERAKALYAERLPKYLAAADCIVENDGSIKSAAEKVIQAIGVSKFI